jgi:hypothetical protein
VDEEKESEICSGVVVGVRGPSEVRTKGEEKIFSMGFRGKVRSPQSKERIH